MTSMPNPDLPFEQQEADTLLAMALWGEARGESVLGIAAVACVILNRMKKRGVGVHQVILARKQFSSFNLDDPNYDKLAFPLRHGPEAWHRCATIAQLALNGFLADPTLGASHYFADSLPKPPYWADPAKGWIQTAKIGAHTFGTAP